MRTRQKSDLLRPKSQIKKKKNALKLVCGTCYLNVHEHDLLTLAKGVHVSVDSASPHERTLSFAVCRRLETCVFTKCVL